MKSKDEIFEGKSFQDLTKDIYKNTTDRKKQIDLLISEIHGFETMLLSDSEKEELMGTLQDVVNDLQKESDKIDGIKEKTTRDTGN